MKQRLFALFLTLLLPACIAIAALVTYVLNKPILNTSVSAGGVKKVDFVLTEPLKQINLEVKPDITEGKAFLHFVNGKSECRFEVTGQKATYANFGLGDGFKAGKHTFTVESDGASGALGIRIEKKGIVFGSLILYALLGLTVCSGAALAIGSVGGASLQTRQILGLYFSWVLFGTVAGIGYTALHETGHLLPMSVFGIADWGASDVFGLGGSPHATPTAVNIPPWQHFYISAGGPMLPNFVGWLGLGLWFAFGKRRRPSIQFVWISLSALLLLGQFGGFLAALGTVQDGDYLSTVANAFISKSIIDGGLILMSVVNAFLIYWAVGKVRSLFAQARADGLTCWPFFDARRVRRQAAASGTP